MRQSWPLLLSEETLPQAGEREIVGEGWNFCLVEEGFCYWLGKPNPLELHQGEMLVAGPRVQGSLRASQINGACIRRFTVDPGALLGVFGVAERNALLQIGSEYEHDSEVLPPGHPAPQLLAQIPVPETLAQQALGRTVLLHVALLALEQKIRGVADDLEFNSAVQKRFRELMLNAPDGELLSHSPEELARICGCTVRYLRRLFRSAFQFSLSAAQEEARLRHARELIEQTGIRISDAARHVGYHHIGQFNASFKRLFGHTPSECRANSITILLRETGDDAKRLQTDESCSN